VTPTDLHKQIRHVRYLTARPFGVNLMVPQCEPSLELAAPAWQAYRAALRDDAVQVGAALPTRPRRDDDDFAGKVDAILAERPAVVSFTFGLPQAHVLRAIQAVGTAVWATVASPEDARAALRARVDGLCLQGPRSGGHRATVHASDPPPTVALERLIAEVRSMTDLPLIAAGGVDGPAAVARLLGYGADAVQVGTLLLGASEAGTHPAHRRALGANAVYGQTVVTRAFTGRPVRAVRNDFVARHDSWAPALYPHVLHLTAPIREAAARSGQSQLLGVWAGTGYRAVRDASAKHIIRHLATGARHWVPAPTSG
jgi:NAD(P)H-dependent flavin oxidoreductase YrpB (nitropropane dioxygenase family)